MSFGKRQSVAASSQPMQKCLKIDLEMKKKIIKKYKKWVKLSDSSISKANLTGYFRSI
jgi:hypothetical protein